MASDNKRYKLLPRGMSIKSGSSLQDTQDALEDAIMMNNATAWGIGDVMIYALDHFGDDAYQIVDTTQKSVGTIKNYTRLCRAFPPSRRKYNLSVSHYQGVMSIHDENEQDALLHRCEVEKIGREELRDIVRGKLPERKTIETTAGVATITLLEDYAVPQDAIVRITFEIVEAVA